MFAVELKGEPAPDAGIYSWDLRNDLVFADAAIADLFGLPSHETCLGLPIKTYLSRVHPFDQAALAEAISQTIIANVPQQHSYRVKGADGTYRAVIGYGRAFRARDGDPLFYAGIIVPLTEFTGMAERRH